MNHYIQTICTIILFTLCGCASAPQAVLPVPEEKQIEWQKMETYAFIHFGLNTFNDKEWGYGDADPSLFNPSRLDCGQWASTLAACGMKGVILTAKHHDGFCLWPSKYTDYSVKNAPWKNGQGDLVRELAEACHEHGLKLGLYLSPWDRHQATYGTPEYVEYYRNQLDELLTNYGDIFEVWFDGANGGDGWYGGANETRSIDRRTYYDFPRLFEIVGQLQPRAVIFSDGGPGCRWVGNERGFAGETNWSFLRAGVVYPGYPNGNELQQGHPDGDQWTTAECDVSIRPGWFYHAGEDNCVKSVEHLTDLYYKSVGRNATLLLNFPVDTSGRINPIDSLRAIQWHQRVRQELSNNLLAGTHPVATNSRGNNFSPDRVIDPDYNTYWATRDDITSATLTFTFKEPQAINRLLIQEYIPLGQRVKSFSIEAKVGDQWQAVNPGEATTTIGYKRILRFDTVKAQAIRINFLEARGPLCINNVEAYHAEIDLN